MDKLKKWALPFFLWMIFEVVAVTLWLTKDNLFYLFNFSYIGSAIALGLVLFIKNHPHARRVVQLLVGSYMLIYLGLICQENMQIEGFWYYLFTGVFEAATIHYAVAKILGPLIFGRGWCGYACWTAMVLDFLPYKTPGKNQTSGKTSAQSTGRIQNKDQNQKINRSTRTSEATRKKFGFLRYVTFALSLIFVAGLFLCHVGNFERIMFYAFLAGNILYYAVGITMACTMKDNRAFCKYICPVTVFLKPMSYFSLIRITCDQEKCIGCGKCKSVCPMEVDMTDPSRRRKNGTECILCMECVKACPKKAL